MRVGLWLAIAGVIAWGSDGARSAELDISVDSRGTGVVLYSGAADVCNPRTHQCSVVRSGCGVALVDDAAISTPSALTERVTYLRQHAPFATDQRPLRSDFRVDTSACGLLADIHLGRPISASPD